MNSDLTEKSQNIDSNECSNGYEAINKNMQQLVSFFFASRSSAVFYYWTKLTEWRKMFNQFVTKTPAVIDENEMVRGVTNKINSIFKYIVYLQQMQINFEQKILI